MTAILRGIFIMALSVAHFAVAGDLEEFCVVQDKDGYSNVREKGSLSGKVIGKVGHGEVVWAFPGKGKGWIGVLFQDENGEESSGFIHSSRLKAMSEFTSISGKVADDGKSESFEKGALRIEISEEPFESKQAKLTYVEVEGGGRYLSEINGKPYWGTDGGMPRTQYGAVLVKQGDTETEFPATALSGLFNPGMYPGNTKVYLDPQSNSIYITSLNSDGAGGYSVAFRIVDGKFKERGIFNPF